MKRLHLFILILLFSLIVIPLFSLSGSAAAASQGAPPLAAAGVLAGYPAERPATGTAPLMFIENVGQFADGARFQMRSAAGIMWLADDALWLSLVDAAETSGEEPLLRGDNINTGPRASLPALPRNDELLLRGDNVNTGPRASLPALPRNDEPLLRGANVKLSFVGASPGVRLEPYDRLNTTVSYFIGNDPSLWHADVPVWGGVRYVGLYPGVDLEVSGEGGRWNWSLVG